MFVTFYVGLLLFVIVYCPVSVFISYDLNFLDFIFSLIIPITVVYMPDRGKNPLTHTKPINTPPPPPKKIQHWHRFGIELCLFPPVKSITPSKAWSLNKTLIPITLLSARLILYMLLLFHFSFDQLIMD